MKIYTAMGGGIGDFILFAQSPGYDFGHFAALKAAGHETMVLLYGVTDSAFDLFDHHRAVDYVARFHFDFTDTWPERAKAFAEPRGFRLLTTEQKERFPWARTWWGLSRSEQALVQRILWKGPFVAFHPFAADGHRDWRKNGLEPEEAAKRVCTAGARVLLLGGSGWRTCDTGEIMRMDDRFGLLSKDVIDLRGKGTVRLQAHLAQRASAFIGAASWGICAALAGHVPILAFAPACIRDLVAKDEAGVFYELGRAEATLHYFDAMPDDPYAVMAAFALHDHQDRHGLQTGADRSRRDRDDGLVRRAGFQRQRRGQGD